MRLERTIYVFLFALVSHRLVAVASAAGYGAEAMALYVLAVVAATSRLIRAARPPRLPRAIVRRTSS